MTTETGCHSDEGLHVLEFDPNAVTIDAVQRAAYKLSDRLSAVVRSGELIECRIYLPKDAEALAILAEFRNEVLDQVLRERIRQETAAVRNMILALAFSNTGVVPVE
jgi:His-Xaa-Ser system protein HxsD